MKEIVKNFFENIFLASMTLAATYAILTIAIILFANGSSSSFELSIAFFIAGVCLFITGVFFVSEAIKSLKS